MRRLSGIVAASTGAAVGMGTAEAGHLGYWNSWDDFYVRVSYMVDFDQQREASLFNPPFVTGLPGNGNMYCVPTSSSDLMAYIDRHGYANVPGVDGPGVEDWSDASDVMAYNIATSYIGDMGLDMNTSTDGGTNNNDNQIYNAVRSRLPAHLFDVCYFGRTNTWAPKARNIGNWMAQGGIVQFCYGRWNIDASGDGLSSRDTGHCVVATKIDKRSFMDYAENEYVINYADPGSGGGSLFTQSDFAYRVETVEDSNYFLPGPGVFRLMSRIMFNSNDGRHRLIDSALAVFPKVGWGVYPTTNQLTLYGGAFQAGSGGGGGISTQTFQMPGEVLAAELSPDRGFASVVTAGTPGGPASTLHHVDLVGGEATPIMDAARPVHAIVHHRDRSLLVAIDSDGTTPAQIKRIEMDIDLPRGEPRLEYTTFLTTPTVAGLAFDDQTDGVFVLADADFDGATDSLFIYDASDNGAPVFDARIDVPEPQQAGDPHYGWIELSIENDPAIGDQPSEIVLADPQAGLITVFILLPNAAGEPELSEAASLGLGGPIDGLSTGDGRRIYVTRNGAVEEYRRDGATIARVTGADASPLAGQPSLGGFGVSRSRTNFVPELHSGPAWENIDPADLPPATQTISECWADLAAPFEVLDLADINAFVSAFAGQDPLADLTADGLFDLQDVAKFVDSYLSGCF